MIALRSCTATLFEIPTDAARANAEGSDSEEACESEEDVGDDDDPAAKVKVYRKDRQALSKLDFKI